MRDANAVVASDALLQDPEGILPRLSSPPPALESEEYTSARVLVVDDDAAVRRTLARILTARGFHVETADGGAAALQQIALQEPDVALIDLSMPQMSGSELLARIKEQHPLVEVIVITAFPDVTTAVSCVKAGAHNFLTKPVTSNEAIIIAVERALDHRRLAQRAQRLEEELGAHEPVGELLGNSAEMQHVYQVVQGVAATAATVLITGESGTGKELVARALHQRSPRASAPFVAVNCAAIPKDLAESEFFGHVRGAFTGAGTARKGVFESADGGTVFLDEIGDLSPAVQVKLLRVLQENEVKRVGSDETRHVDVRVISATNVDLQEKIASGEFRRDLYYRLNVVPIALPPLRARGDDVLLLAEHFLRKVSRKTQRPPKPLSVTAMSAMRSYEWPGNVRELEHAIERAVLLSRGHAIEPEDLGIKAAPEEQKPPPVPAPSARLSIESMLDLPYGEAKRRLLTMFDETYSEQLIARCGGRVAEAARQSGLDRSNFRRIMRRAKRTP